MTEPSFKLQGRCTGGFEEAKNIGCSFLLLWKPLLVGFCFVMGGYCSVSFESFALCHLVIASINCNTKKLRKHSNHI